MTVPICILCSLVHLNGPEKASDFDQYGRYTDATRRNVYANFFHIAITSFVIEVTVDSKAVGSYNVGTIKI
ncbi:hypothetical protein DD237_007960 [Peronospora effusa]|uniref:Uncharacterized protein n=1 Tax=Peronospora effusa TaxID=542832 RepID=A0A3R7WJ85_9STRA|nr:hypothetical protein DD237_007960 [Peronospora effusa]